MLNTYAPYRKWVLIRGAIVKATPNQLYLQRASYAKMRGKGRSYSDHDEQVSDNSIHPHESVIHGSHVSKEIWTPQLGEILLVSKEARNAHDRRVVPVFLGCLRQ